MFHFANFFHCHSDIKPTMVKNLQEKLLIYLRMIPISIHICIYYLVQTMWFIGWNTQKMILNIRSHFQRWFASVKFVVPLCEPLSLVSVLTVNFLTYFWDFSATRRHKRCSHDGWFLTICTINFTSIHECYPICDRVSSKWAIGGLYECAQMNTHLKAKLPISFIYVHCTYPFYIQYILFRYLPLLVSLSLLFFFCLFIRWNLKNICFEKSKDGQITFNYTWVQVNTLRKSMFRILTINSIVILSLQIGLQPRITLENTMAQRTSKQKIHLYNVFLWMMILNILVSIESYLRPRSSIQAKHSVVE